jgi:hypothetical protein
MLRGFYLLQAAELERDEAIGWYERERPGLGLQFLERYEATVQHALRFPDAGSHVTDRRLARDVRRHLLEQFPYDLVTTVAGEHLVVVAVAHHKRRPGYWRRRLAKVVR